MGGNEKVVDIYDGCIVLEFTETFEDTPRTLTANHNNVITYLERLIVDGVEQPIQKNFQYTFGLGTHKIGWKLNTTIVYASIIGYACLQANRMVDMVLLIIPIQITGIRSMALRGVPVQYPQRGVICYAIIPPIAVTTSFNLWGQNPIRVPAESVDAYKIADGWSQFANKIIAI